MFQIFKKILSSPDLRYRIIFTTVLLILFRFIAHIPLPWIDRSQLQNFFSGNQLLGLLNIFSGGALSNLSIGFMAVGPYITSSIIIQLLGYVIPSLEALQREGEQGRQILSQYIRLLTIPLGLVQSFGLITILQRQGVLSSFSPQHLAVMLIVSTAATILIMWIGELISEQGIGNGISLIITAGIIGGIPTQITDTYAIVAGGGILDSAKLFGIIAFLIVSILTVSFIIFVNDAVRRIPISYARRVIGRRSFGGVDTYLPLKINTAGVIPIIFALSIIVFPGLIARYLEQAKSPFISHGATAISRILDPNGIVYGIIYFILVVAFTYFYTAIVFKPTDVAENLQKQGGFIPGIRPGKETILYLSRAMSRITLPGALFLGIIAILPFIIQSVTRINTLIIGGTSILIIVSVIMDTISQIKAHLATQSYDHYGS